MIVLGKKYTVSPLIPTNIAREEKNYCLSPTVNTSNSYIYYCVIKLCNVIFIKPFITNALFLFYCPASINSVGIWFARCILLALILYKNFLPYPHLFRNSKLPSFTFCVYPKPPLPGKPFRTILLASVK